MNVLLLETDNELSWNLSAFKGVLGHILFACTGCHHTATIFHTQKKKQKKRHVSTVPNSGVGWHWHWIG